MPSSSKNKGSGFERQLAKTFNEWYNTTEFMRTPLSGSFFGGSNAVRGPSADVRNSLSADIITPKWFKWSVEAKFYADKPCLYNVINGKDSTLSLWLGKSCFDAINQNLLPMVAFKRNNKGMFFAIPQRILPTLPKCCMLYNQFAIIDETTMQDLKQVLADISELQIYECIEWCKSDVEIQSMIKLHTK